MLVCYWWQVAAIPAVYIEIDITIAVDFGIRVRNGGIQLLMFDVASITSCEEQHPIGCCWCGAYDSRVVLQQLLLLVGYRCSQCCWLQQLLRVKYQFNNKLSFLIAKFHNMYFCMSCFSLRSCLLCFLLMVFFWFYYCWCFV